MTEKEKKFINNFIDLLVEYDVASTLSKNYYKYKI